MALARRVSAVQTAISRADLVGSRSHSAPAISSGGRPVRVSSAPSVVLVAPGQIADLG